MAESRYNADELYEKAKSGDRRSLGRLVTMIESGYFKAGIANKSILTPDLKSILVGITGAPGAGKSTLTSQLIGQIRNSGNTVSVIAIDPSSPFTGGAILGDRIRMGEHAMDPGVYIRSLATRGQLGGVSAAVPEVVKLMSSLGFNYILVETVGVGQVEVEIVGQADTTVVVVNPGWGDSVQANKAGLMEIADIFVINKADRPGAKETARDLKSMLELSGNMDWTPPICETVGTDGTGVRDLLENILNHRQYLVESGILTKKVFQRTKNELLAMVNEAIVNKANGYIETAEGTDLIKSIVDGREDMTAAAKTLFAMVTKNI